MKSTITLLCLLSLFVAKADPRRVLAANVLPAAEHQRLLSELEEVHQLRERMLQEGTPT